uniref:Coatomer subunit gamma-2 n=1 Tax=Junco hyemalis TaxID=40217 RepID=A0A8C5NTJ1_JUNHY
MATNATIPGSFSLGFKGLFQPFMATNTTIPGSFRLANPFKDKSLHYPAPQFSLCGDFQKHQNTQSTLPLTYPSSDSLSSLLGGFEYKRAIVDCIISIIEENPESKEAGLAHLCEFIEDCEHTVLATKILHLLGKEGPRTPCPSKYIRFIFNRVVLENEAVRAAAVSALAKFGAQNENLLPSILVLLQRSVRLGDTGGCTRDDTELPNLNSSFPRILHGLIKSSAHVNFQSQTKFVYNQPSSLFWIGKRWSKNQEMKGQVALLADQSLSLLISFPSCTEQLAAIPEFKGLGPLFKSSEPVQLTEAETEYFVRCIKHVFPAHIVFQFDCTNTLNDQLLERVTVQLEPSEGYDVICCVPAPSLAYNQPAMCYTLVSIPQEEPTAVGCTFSCTMRFTVRDCDPSTGVPEEDGYEDEYVVSPASAPCSPFSLLWEKWNRWVSFPLNPEISQCA